MGNVIERWTAGLGRWAWAGVLWTAWGASAQFVAFNDHAPGPGTAGRATTLAVPLDWRATSGLLRDATTGERLLVSLTITASGVSGSDLVAYPAANTPLFNVFNGFVDFGGSPNPTILLPSGSGASVQYVFGGLDPNKRYRFQGGAVRGGGFTNRWTLIELAGAETFVSAHTAGCLTNGYPGLPDGSIASNQTAISMGQNDARGDMADWTQIAPGEDGSFTIICRRYNGPVPGGTSDGPYAYALTAIRLEELAVQPAAPAIIRQPEAVTTDEFGSAIFAAEARGNPPPAYQWLKNDQPLAGATNASLNLTNVLFTDNLAVFKVVASNWVNEIPQVVTSAGATLTVRPDTNPPVFLNAYAPSPTQIRLTFSERLSEESATNRLNYLVTNQNGSVSVTGAALEAGLTNVLLTVGALANDTLHTVVVNNVRDLAAASNTVPANSAAAFLAMFWNSQNLGGPAISGAASVIAGGHRLTGGGTNIAGASDQFFFYYKAVTGDFDVRVRVAAVGLSDVWAKAGVMAREDLNANGRFAAALATPGLSGIIFSARAAAGANATHAGGYPVNHPHTWVRLQRAGTNLIGYAGLDGRNWTVLGTVALSGLGSTMQLGYAACGRSTNAATVAVFQDFGQAGGGNVVSAPFPAEPLGPSSRRTGLVITEIMYDPPSLPGGDNSLEFVEIFNSQPYFEDISGYRLSGDIGYTFPAGTVIPGGGFVVVARSPQTVEAYYGLSGVFGPFENNLPNDAGRVRLRHRLGAVLLEVNYDSRPPWPVAAAGTGHSLSLARASYGEDDPRAWAASDRLGGSPGGPNPWSEDPLSPVVINEFRANSTNAQTDFIELYNHGNTPVDLSGAWLADKRAVLYDATITTKFRIPDNTLVPPRGFVAFSQTQLGFGLERDGETIIFANSNLTRVIDMAPFEGQMPGVSSGRYPDGAPGFHPLLSSTAGTNNSPLFIHDIVINEIMYNPISNDDNDEFIELYNQGPQPVSLSGWRFTAGIDYTFPAGALIAPDGYVVVAKNRERLLANYPHLSSSQVFGNYDGVLANGGERVALSMADPTLSTNSQQVIITNINYYLVDEVTYDDGGRWSDWTDGGGSSLELMDPRADNRQAGNWADSDESAKSEWTTIDHTGALNQGRGNQSTSELHVMLLGAGECLVDNLEVFIPGGNNLAPNPTLESGLSQWIIQGNHVRSGLANEGYQSARSLYVRATGGGDNGANRLKTELPVGLTSGTATIRAKAKWLRGHPDLLLRLYGNYLEAPATLRVPKNLGTPGQRNSRALANNGPAIWEVSHFPVLPAAGTNVLVTARVHDVDGLGSVLLRYRLEANTTYTSVTMRDDGTLGDAVANDGLYSGVIPGQSAGALVAFYVQATDAHTAPATKVFPEAAPAKECLVRFGDPAIFGNFGAYRIWMLTTNISTWTSREKLSNEPLDGTLVYGNFRAIYNAGARYRGSPFIRPGYNTPTGNACGYIWTTPNDEPFLGVDELNLDSLEPGSRDSTALREMTAFWMAEQLGLPFCHQRYVHVVINGVTSASRNIPVYTDSQQPNSDFIRCWFPDDDRGELFKIDDWFEFDDAVAREWNENGRLLIYNDTATGQKKQARYRWSWEKKFNRTLNDDYSSLFKLVDTVNTTGSAYAPVMEANINLEEWIGVMAFRHTIGDWDGYGYNRGKNQSIYKPVQGKWQMLLWDLDFSLGCGGGHSWTQNLWEHDTGETTINTLYANPHMRRIYLRMLERAAKGPFVAANVGLVIDARYQALLANGANPTSPYVNSGAQSVPIPTWIENRRTNILANIPSANFSVAGAETIVSGSQLVNLSGTAPLSLRTLKVNGQDYFVNWSTETNWSVSLYLNDATNVYTLLGYDVDGNALSNMTATKTVVFSGAAPPAEGTVVFSEIMYRPTVTNAEYVEIFNHSATFTFDLSNWRINGLGYTFPVNTLLPPRQTKLVVANLSAFTNAYGTNSLPAVAGVYPGRLDPDGETLTLLRPPPPGDEANTERVVDRVRYEPSAPWPAMANGQGSALQLLDSGQDNSRVMNWSDGFGWQLVSVTGSNLNVGSSTNILIMPGGPGELYLDDFMLVSGKVAGAGINLITNGGFEEPLSGTWTLATNLTNSSISTEVKHSGQASLRLVSTRAGTALSTSMWQPVDVQSYANYTLSFWYLPSTTMTSLTVRVTSQVRTNGVQVLNSGFVFSPGKEAQVATALPALPPLWLNEVQPFPQDGMTDNFGEASPWIEIHNAGTNSVSLDGLFLSDNYSALNRWAFPSNAVIAPGGFLVVWADGESAQSDGTNWHTNFRLATNAGSVALSLSLGGGFSILDYLNYTNVAPGQTYGDYPDGQLFYRQKFTVPTPGAPNNPAAPAGQLFINEWMASNTRTLVETNGWTYEDWFEIYNPGDEPVDLGGYFLTDDPAGNPLQFEIPPGYFVPARGYLLVWADNAPSRNSAASPDLHVNFALSRTGESIGLFAPNGSLVDGVVFGAQSANVSQGRYPDGSADLIFMTNATPRAANQSGAVIANHPPIFNAPGPQSLILGQTLTMTLNATDSDVPAQTLVFALNPGAPAGAEVTPQGLFSWTPTPAQAPSTNTISVRVTDSGSPPLSATNSFVVLVGLPPAFSGGEITVQGNSITFGFQSVPGKQYQVQFKDNLGDPHWQNLGAPQTAVGASLNFSDNLNAQPHRYYRVISVD